MCWAGPSHHWFNKHLQQSGMCLECPYVHIRHFVVSLSLGPSPSYTVSASHSLPEVSKNLIHNFTFEKHIGKLYALPAQQWVNEAEWEPSSSNCSSVMTPILNQQNLELSWLKFSKLRKRFILGYCLKAFVKSSSLPLPCLGLPNELCLPVPGLETRNDWSHWFPN